MRFKRITGPSYPQTYDTWQTGDTTWVIQDLPPEDDDAALRILEENMLPDETLCRIQKLVEHPPSVYHVIEFWRECLAQRMSLGCYEERDGQKALVALNVCLAVYADEELDIEVKGEKWKNVYDVLTYVESKADPFEHLGLDLVLEALGLVVKREYRGAKLGKRLLAAREPLCKSQGIKGTATVFTGIASQKLAASCGFHTIAEVPIRELAAAGLPYPSDSEQIIKELVEHPPSVYHVIEFWRECLAQRMSLGCYEERDGQKALVALNVCLAVYADEELDIEVKGEKWKNVYDVLTYVESKADPFEHLGLDLVLEALGLVVKREYRGAKLGKRLLAAREPLCKTQGIKGTATVFTGIASQKLAASCGFHTIAEVPIRELAAAGLPYPSDSEQIIKYMIKKFF